MGTTLQVEHLTVQVATSGGAQTIVDDVSFRIEAGKVLALVGESGSGKSMTCTAIMRMLADNARISKGRVLLEGDDLVGKTPKEMQNIRSRKVGMVLQDAMGSLNPLFTIGNQLGEVIDGNRAAVRERAVQLMERVGISAPEDRIDAYPHQLSGGMRQRISIAINIARNPALLIADEPTTALDATVQLQILSLLRRLQRENAMAMLLVTHDLGVVARFCDRVAIMYAGRIVEEGPVDGIFARPMHPYTRALLDAVPRLDALPERLAVIAGQAPSFKDKLPGCSFATRCPMVQDRCRQLAPPWTAAGERAAACWLATQVVP